MLNNQSVQEVLKAANVGVQGDTHVDGYLTNFQLKFIQSVTNFVALQASTRIPVSNKSDLYPKYPRGYFMRDLVQPRALGGQPVRTGYKIEQGTYNAVEYALAHPIDDRQRANTDAPINLDENATELLTGQQLIRQDRYFATEFFKPGVWSTDLQGVGGSSPGSDEFLQWNFEDSNPIREVNRRKTSLQRLTGFRPNSIVMGAKVFDDLANHPDVIDRIKHVGTGIVDEAKMAELFGVPRLAVARAIYNSADEGATDSFQFIIAENDMWMGYVAPTPSLNVPTALATFMWTGLMPGMTNAEGGVIETLRDSLAYSDIIISRSAWDMKLVSADLGVYFHDAVVAEGSTSS